MRPRCPGRPRRRRVLRAPVPAARGPARRPDLGPRHRGARPRPGLPDPLPLDAARRHPGRRLRPGGLADRRRPPPRRPERRGVGPRDRRRAAPVRPVGRPESGPGPRRLLQLPEPLLDRRRSARADPVPRRRRRRGGDRLPGPGDAGRPPVRGRRDRDAQRAGLRHRGAADPLGPGGPAHGRPGLVAGWRRGAVRRSGRARLQSGPRPGRRGRAGAGRRPRSAVRRSRAARSAQRVLGGPQRGAADQRLPGLPGGLPRAAGHRRAAAGPDSRRWRATGWPASSTSPT